MHARTASFPALLVASGLALCACSKGAPPPPAPPVAPASAEASPKTPALDPSEPLAWLAGSWCGKDEDQLIEETWFAPHANELLGMSRTLAGGRMISFEFMRIMDLEGTITLVAQPGGQPPTNFKRTDGGKDWVRFENPKHDYPTRIEYRRAGEGLHAEIDGPGANNRLEAIPYDYQRCK